MTGTHKVYGMDDWQEMLEARDRGELLEVTDEIWWHFYEVLPPVLWSGSLIVGGVRRIIDFGFAEGEEPITAFWTVQERRYCQRTEIINYR